MINYYFVRLVAWAEKFKAEREVQAMISAESWVIDLFSRTRLMRYLGNED